MIKNILDAILFYLSRSSKIKFLEYNTYHVYSFAWIALLAHPTFWFIWTVIDPMIETLLLRIIGFFSSMVLLIIIYNIQHWYFRKILPYYWIFMVSYNLPFFFTANLFRNEFVDVWLMAEIVMIFVTTIFIPNIIYSFVVIIVNFVLALFFIQTFFYHNITYPLGLLLHHLPIYLLSFFSAHVFSYASIIGSLLKEKNKSLRSLAGSIAHELRNPLGAIKLATESLETDGSSQKETENIEFFKKQINKTIILASDIIDLNLRELSGQKLNKDDFRFLSAKYSIINSLIIYGYKNNNEKKRVKIDLGNGKVITADEIDNIDINPASIPTDDYNFIFNIVDTPFKYIIFNLVKNSLFYAKDNPDLEVIISFEKNKKISKKIIEQFKLNSKIKLYNIINITDNGVGISEENIKKIFDSYFTSGKNGGTGLGLDFCKRTMKEFGGDIIIESNLGEYTKFSLLFPILDQEEEKEAIKKLVKIEMLPKIQTIIFNFS